MPYRKSNIWLSLDWWTAAIYLIMVIAGWINIYASGYDFDQVSIFNLSGRAGMQMVWILTSLLIGFSILMIDSDWYDIFAYWIYALVILLLIATILFSHDIRGSRSWLVLGPVRIQSAEFAKFATALAVARLASNYNFDLMRMRDFIKILPIFFLPMALILLQKETGTALVFLAFFLVLYREGMSGFILFSGFCAVLFFVIEIRYGDVLWGGTPLGKWIVLLLIIPCISFILYDYEKGRQYIRYFLIGSGVLVGLAVLVSLFFIYDLCFVVLAIIAIITAVLLFLFLKYREKHYLYIVAFALLSVVFIYSVDYVFDDVLEPHQKVRIEVALGTIDDPGGAGYNVNQSKIAIGSGGLWGKGYLNGTQTKLKYVPEQDTDFIFCTVGEEHGFVGSVFILLLFLFLITRLIFLAERQRSTFKRIYGYSVAAIIFFHLLINIGMVIGLTPVIGIPLPFFSYGGSSLWGFTILLFIFLRLDASRNERL
ncbi:MAG: rod shape-determining protein RodA [Candidatus Azobacteroides sp.]|nr:rod shape-determining protein RodA [Candidatus Azobacteroides sp.]